jgi:Flp pilus assembly protein TadD
MGFKVSRDLRRTASRIAIAAAAASLLTGCGSAGVFSNNTNDQTIAALEKGQPEAQDYVGGAAYWGAKYEANRQDTSAALNFARNLRLMGGARQAVAVLKEIVMKTPDDPKVMAEYGKALTASGRFQDAIPFLARCVQMDGADWSTLSTYGVALDQAGNHLAAQANYQAALKLSPENPSVESNLAMSYVLSGRIGEGEIILRRLVARPDASAQMRQNLAMIESLKGNATEAAQLAREDLPEEQASNNLAVLKQLDAQNAPTRTVPDLATPAAAETTATEPAVEPIAEPAPATTSALETTPVAQVEPPAAPTPAPAATTQPASRFTMQPVVDEEEPVAPKATTAPKPVTPPAKDKVAATAKPAAMLRKSVDEKTISLASQ